MNLTAKQWIIFALAIAGIGLLTEQALIIVVALACMALRLLNANQRAQAEIAAFKAEGSAYIAAIDREYSASKRDHGQYDKGVIDALDTYAYIAKTFRARAAYQQSGKRTVKLGYMGSTGVFMPCFVLARGKMTPLFTMPSMAAVPALPVPPPVEPEWIDWQA